MRNAHKIPFYEWILVFYAVRETLANEKEEDFAMTRI